MERIEQSIVRECLREVAPWLGLPFGQLAKRLAEMRSRGAEQDAESKWSEIEALKFLNNQPVSAKIALMIAEYGLIFLVENKVRILEDYKARHQTIAVEHLTRLLNRYQGDDVSTVPEASKILDKLWVNWADTFERNFIKPGLYQIFRRYKPFPGTRHMYDSILDHPVICELIYIDTHSMEVTLITAGHNIYWGSIYMNYQQIAYIMAQRQSNQNKGGVHQRFYSFRPEGGLPEIFSGLCLKTGDGSRRPVCAECLFLQVFDDENEELIAEVKKLVEEPWSSAQSESSVILDYISDIPPEFHLMGGIAASQRPRVKHVRDFPLLAELVQYGSGDISLFREPLRPVDAETLRREVLRYGVEVFRHSRPPRTGVGS